MPFTQLRILISYLFLDHLQRKKNYARTQGTMLVCAKQASSAEEAAKKAPPAVLKLG